MEKHFSFAKLQKMETIAKVIATTVAKVIDRYMHVDPKNLKIRIPPDYLTTCFNCNTLFSLAHVSDCPGCS